MKTYLVKNKKLILLNNDPNSEISKMGLFPREEYTLKEGTIIQINTKDLLKINPKL